MITIPDVDPKMIANNLTPFIATHPGELLKDEIEYRGISQRKLAAQIGISHTLLNEILNCKRPVSVEFALLIEVALDLDADMLLRMQSKYDMLTAKRDKTLCDRLDQVRKACAML